MKRSHGALTSPCHPFCGQRGHKIECPAIVLLRWVASKQQSVPRFQTFETVEASNRRPDSSPLLPTMTGFLKALFLDRVFSFYMHTSLGRI